MGFILNIVASLLKWLLQPLCFTFGAVLALKKREFNKWNEDLAYCKDVLGNVLIKYVADLVLITKKSTHKFGNKKETISFVIGKNKVAFTLSYWGLVLDGVLDFFDPGHSLHAIGRTERVVHKVKFNKMLWLYITGASTIIFGVLTNWIEWAYIPMFISLLYPFGLGIALIIYAFIINPINNYKNKYN